jgi:GNAT superfamily N-acetyltransferase
VALQGELQLQDRPAGAGDTCRNILGALPSWFGIPASVENYVAVADRSPTVIASLEGREIGMLTVVRHSPYAAELYVMGVLPDFHRQGVGQALLQYAEGMLAADGVGFLQVKTLSPSKPDAGYENTRAFYFSCGFRPLEEFPDLWGPDDPALQMIKIVPESGMP